jgi:poly(3-hydroxybutyrate) depolymerase
MGRGVVVPTSDVTGVPVGDTLGVIVRPDTGTPPPTDIPRFDAGTDRGLDVPRDQGPLSLDLPSSDVSVPRDPVAYSGVFPVRTDGRIFLTTLRVLGERRDVWVRMPRTLGRNVPLLLAFHGTNSDGQNILQESGADALVDREGLVVIAPSSRWFGDEGSDFDHPGGNGTYWETANNPNPDTNADLVLTRAVIEEARRAYDVDPTRIYTYGHSNGGFMAYFVAQVLRDRIAGFSENAAGLSRCNPQQMCRFEGRGTACAMLTSQPGWCNCGGAELPVAMATSGRRPPGVLFHGTADPLVSVYHTCMLEASLRARGIPVTTTLFDNGGHSVFENFATAAYNGLARYRLAP